MENEEIVKQNREFESRRNFEARVINNLNTILETSSGDELMYNLSLSNRHISVLDYSKYIKSLITEWESRKRNYSMCFNTTKESSLGLDYKSGFTIVDFDYTNEIMVVKTKIDYTEGVISITKRDGKIVPVGDGKHDSIGDDFLESRYTVNDIISGFYHILSCAFDDYLIMKRIINDLTNATYNAINANFNIEIHANGNEYNVCLIDKETLYYALAIVGKNDGIISVYDDKGVISNKMKDNSKNLLSKMYLSIDELPFYFRDDLIELRNKQLTVQENYVVEEPATIAVEEPIEPVKKKGFLPFGK